SLVYQWAHDRGAAMIDNDARDSGCYRGFHVGGLLRIIGLRVVELHLEADGVGLLPGPLGPLLEVVARAAVLDQRDLHRAMVEGRRLLQCRAACGAASRLLPIAVGTLGTAHESERGA